MIASSWVVYPPLDGETVGLSVVGGRPPATASASGWATSSTSREELSPAGRVVVL